MKNYFYKTGLDITKAKQCFEFLARHSTYYTMSSWNAFKSIANNVKIYGLGLEGDAWNALTLLENEDYFTVNEMIRDWELEHEGYAVGFNGKSGGWLVLYNKGNYLNVLPDELTGDYEYFKEYCKDHCGSVESYMSTLREYVRLVQDFDRLCDQIREYVNELSKRDPVEVIAGEKLDAFNEEYREERLVRIPLL